ncbi:MAG: hypothetical protein GX777_07660, partial [Fastidiosipila sp.]|nr:hypothetical protein [Fastidiosipila sp.]
GSITGTNYDIDNSGELTFTGDMTINRMMLKDGSDAPEVTNKGTMTIASDATLSGFNTSSIDVSIKKGQVKLVDFSVE